jgi:hypothetical protein
MTIFDSLANYGLTVDMLQVAIVGGVFLVLIGMYWQFFAIGTIVVFCAFTFAGTPSTSTPKLNEFKDKKIQEIQKIEDARRTEFLNDCVHYGDTLRKCELIWDKEN